MTEHLCPKCGAYWQCECWDYVAGFRNLPTHDEAGTELTLERIKAAAEHMKNWPPADYLDAISDAAKLHSEWQHPRVDLPPGFVGGDVEIQIEAC